MVSKSGDYKIVLLLTPQRLSEGAIPLESLHISREEPNKGVGGMLRFTACAFSPTEVSRHYGVFPRQVTEILVCFQEGWLSQAKTEIRKKFTTQRGGMVFEPYFSNALLRKWHELFSRFLPFASLLKWYHKVPDGKGRYKTGPCQFSPFRPQLGFHLEKSGDSLRLATSVILHGTPYDLDGFNRHEFLLESGNEYFLIQYKDYQTLEWLADNKPQQYQHDPQGLVANILDKLAEDYPVDHRGLLEKKEVLVTPTHRVMLSEISGSFLVLTPQWLYDGFLAEGPWKINMEFVRSGVTYRITRDRASEQAFLKMLESLHGNFSRQLNGYYYLSFAEAQHKQWFLKTYHRLLELNIELVGMDMLQHFRYSPHAPVVTIRLGKPAGNLISMELRVQFGEQEVQLSELQKMVLAGAHAILLSDGSLGVLPEEWLKKYNVLIRHGKISGRQLEIPRWLAFPELESGQEDGLLKPVLMTSWLEKWKMWQQDRGAVYEVPPTVEASLRPYQQKGFEWMLLLAEAGAGACLADDMGLGKTLQTICCMAYRMQLDPTARFLIICPSSLIFNWKQELQKFAPSFRVLVHHGPDRSPDQLQEAGYSVIITSYGTARSDMDYLSLLHFDLAILDESHNIKNPAAQITRAVARLQTHSRIALSGTPVMNNTFDLYAQLDFLLPGLLGNREFFRRQYADAIDRDNDPEKILALQKLTAPFLLRRTKQQVAGDLPPRTETVLWCEMSPAQQWQYEQIRDRIRSSLLLHIKADGLSKNKLAVLQGILKLRQVCNSPLLLPADEQTCTDSVKTDVLLEELSNNLKDHKVLVFSQFARMLDLLSDACRAKGIPFYHFDGQTPPARRAEMVTAFQDPADRTNVFLISLKVGNAGLNLTAAGYVFLFDPWWNTAVQQQAIDRTHRIGQDKNVFAYKMICKNTIEEKIIELQQRKKKLAEELVSEDEGFVKSLTEEEVQFLFS